MGDIVNFGLDPSIAQTLRACFDEFVGIERVWIYGSRARGDHRSSSDIDLMVDAPDWSLNEFSQLWAAIDDLRLLCGVDLTHWQSTLSDGFRLQVEKDRQLFWQPRRAAVSLPRALGFDDLKKFQSESLDRLDAYLAELRTARADSEQALAAMAQVKAMEKMSDAKQSLADFPRAAWQALHDARALPEAYAERPHSSRFDGAGRAIPNVCLKVPTGGGKTLLAAASVGKVFGGYLRRSTGLVLWVVPNEAIYRQTLKTLTNRDHPYRQMLNVAGAGRVKILEKDSPLSRLDVESHLCVMVLMLASAARQSKETLRFFRDRGNVQGFLPFEDNIEAHWALLADVPNLDVYASVWTKGSGSGSGDAQASQKGSIVKSSLGNVMRLLRPMVVIDEGHHGYTDNALRTIDGFNPSFMLELSATPRVAQMAASGAVSGSNILVDVRGVDLDEAEMIKLPIHVDVRHWADWQSCVAASVEQLNVLTQQAEALQGQTDRYIRPILLVQVERTGKDQVDTGYIHAQHVRMFLAQLGFADTQIREKTSDKDELGDEDLLSPMSPVRVIITKQALQEGWDCPFAYVLCSLAASKGIRALTQLVGRILRLPQVAKTGQTALDACYVFCHDASTGEVVKAIKRSLESEGMGDLGMVVHGDGAPVDAPRTVNLRRGEGLEDVRIFLPTVTWREPGKGRRSLVYESDVLAHLDWQALDVEALAADWKPGEAAASGGGATRLTLDLSLLKGEPTPVPVDARGTGVVEQIDKARIVRALLDIAPNPWMAWEWVEAVVARCLTQWAEPVVARATVTLIEQLRHDLQGQQEALAQQAFERFVGEGQIEFALRMDVCDYELPMEWELTLSGKVPRLTRKDGLSDVEKGLLVPAVQTPDMNQFELAFAGYLDEQHALRWWHRNVAKTQYGLQGWRKHRVFPDFVFALNPLAGKTRLVLLETKGIQLSGNPDTEYKRQLFERLTLAYQDLDGQREGELALEKNNERVVVTCDVVFDQNWQSTMDARYFSQQAEG